MRSKVRWEEMFADELRVAREAFPLVYLPYGICEPHGPQNALGLDGLKAHALCVRAARMHGGVVAPAVFWHVAETGINRDFMRNAGVSYAESFLTCVPTDLFLKTFLYQIRAVSQRGFRAFIAVTGHYGGIELDMADVAAVFHRHCPTPHWVIADWQCIWHEDYAGDHAGVCETSQLMALRPECVDMTKLPAEEGWSGFASSAKAHAASRELGEGIVASQVGNLGDAAKRLVDAAPNELPEITYDQVEHIWKEYLQDEALLHAHRIGSLDERKEEAAERHAAIRQARQECQARMNK